jgi:serine phosphatase RsbU (regulator of sigma subunit)/anti-sigma regulatory factor (Ser/Thr protein kinase)
VVAAERRDRPGAGGTDVRSVMRRSPGRRLGLVAGAVAIVLAALAVLFALDSYQAGRTRASADVRAAAAQAASDTGPYTIARLNDLGALTRKLPVEAGNPRAVQELLRRMAPAQAGFPGGLVWLDATGALHTSTDLGIGDGGAAAAFLRGVLRSGRASVSDALPVPAFGGDAVVYAVPVRRPDGKRVGVLAGGVPVDWLSRASAAYRLPESGHLWIGDRSLRLIAGPGVRSARDVSRSPLAVAAVSSSGRGGMRTGVQGFGGGPVSIVAWATEQRSGWTLFVAQPEAVAFGPASDTLRKQLLGIGFVLLLGAACIGVLAWRFDRLAAGQEAARTSAERRLRQARSLGELSASLAGAVGVGDVRGVVLQWALEAFDADVVALVEKDGDGTRLHRSSAAEPLPETTRLHRDDGVAGVLGRRVPVWPESTAVLVPTFQALDVQPARATTGLAVPLAFAGETVAVVLAVSRDPHVFDDEDREHWRAFAAQAAQALERARLNEREREIAAEFQSRLLPDVLSGDGSGATIAAVYRPAESEMPIGGDWYDAIPLPDGRVVLAVGDVIGHGVQAAVVMGQLRTAIITLAPICDGPAELLERLDAFTEQVDGGEFSTVQCAYVDISTGVMRSASAGHPPMIVIDADGRASYVWEGRSAPLCVASTEEKPEDARLLAQSSTLLLFTDGIYERRDSTVDDRMRQLLEVCERTASASPRDLAEAVVEQMLAGGRATDDVAVLTLRLDEQLAPARVFSVQPRPSELAGLRASVHAWLHEFVADESRRHQIVLAVHEAVANAVEHGSAASGAPATIVVEFALRPGAVEVVVRDNGRWQERDPFHIEWEDERGRGLSIIERIASRAKIDRSRGTVVRMLFDTVPVAAGQELEAAPGLPR